MHINEEYDPNRKVWYCGRRDKLDKFYKPSPERQMFFSDDPHYALLYMDDNKNSWCVVTTVNRFKLKVFDFTDINDVKKLKYPKCITKILVKESFYLAMGYICESCMLNDTFHLHEVDDEAREWFQEKFKELLSNKKLCWYESGGPDREALYQFQAIILKDLVKLGFNAYYNYEYEGTLDSANSLVLFNIDAIDKVLPIQLNFEDMQNLVNDIDNGEIDSNDISQIKDFVAACTGVLDYDRI